MSAALSSAAAIAPSASAPVITIAAGSSAATIQAAINSAAAGTRIVLQEGTYTFNKTVVLNKDGITLEGQGNVTSSPIILAGRPRCNRSALFRETEQRSIPRGHQSVPHLHLTTTG